MTPPAQLTDRILRVRGTVQGVGFRPFVVRVATELGLHGWVKNDAHGVLLRARGEPARVEALADALVRRAPPAARVLAIEPVVPTAADPPVADAFVAVESTAAAGPVATSVPVDLALCADCRRELLDPANRRHGYVFINCTQCGPRYSIIESLPYDRPRTTMRGFVQCPSCQREYDDVQDRRFHAEPNACPVCGPRLVFSGRPAGAGVDSEAALIATATALRAGQIAAVKGVGGYHLLCDATRETTVAELRRRKHREEKPLAVMFRDVAALQAYAVVSPQVEMLLTSPAAPIVLVPRLPGTDLAPSVAPGNPWIGALIASTPLHVRLLGLLPFPVVATSGNLSDEPLCIDDADAAQRLGAIADAFLGNTRPIARPVDDSVVRFSARGTSLLLRRARGYAPAPLALPRPLPAPVLCVGGHMKNTVAVAYGDQVVLSPHIGDLGGAATRAVFTRTIDTLSGLFGTQPAAIACDKHPDYASTRYAEESGLPVVSVQHHLAHVLAVLLEHRRPAENVLGIACDGTGFGEDGTIWGGEFIRLHDGRAERFARLRPFRLPGGEAAVRDVRRTALSLAHGIDADCASEVARRLGFKAAEAATLGTMLDSGLNAPSCTSAGRLFDGVGALLGLRTRNAFEGQTPMAVEIAATEAPQSDARLPFAVRSAAAAARWEIDWVPAIAAIVEDRRAEVAQVALAFHRGLAAAIGEMARLSGVRTAVLSGGCFQNALLLDLAIEELTAAGLEVLVPRNLPANDGAIAAGQALAALWNLTTVTGGDE